MPKTCNYTNCTYNVWGGGYCYGHRGYRTDKKPKQLKQSEIKPSKPRTELKRTPIAKESAKRKREHREYTRLNKIFMAENPICQFHGCGNRSTECHHKKGRGKHYLWVKYFMACCSDCHKWIHANPAKARELKYLI